MLLGNLEIKEEFLITNKYKHFKITGKVLPVSKINCPRKTRAEVGGSSIGGCCPLAVVLPPRKGNQTSFPSEIQPLCPLTGEESEDFSTTGSFLTCYPHIYHLGWIGENFCQLCLHSLFLHFMFSGKKNKNIRQSALDLFLFSNISNDIP